MKTLTIHHTDHQGFPNLSERLPRVMHRLMDHEDNKKGGINPVRVTGSFIELTYEESEFPTLHAFLYEI